VCRIRVLRGEMQVELCSGGGGEVGLQVEEVGRGLEVDFSVVWVSLGVRVRVGR
jgi:hypothetical protein